MLSKSCPKMVPFATAKSKSCSTSCPFLPICRCSAFPGNILPQNSMTSSSKLIDRNHHFRVTVSMAINMAVNQFSFFGALCQPSLDYKSLVDALQPNSSFLRKQATTVLNNRGWLMAVQDFRRPYKIPSGRAGSPEVNQIALFSCK